MSPSQRPKLCPSTPKTEIEKQRGDDKEYSRGDIGYGNRVTGANCNENWAFEVRRHRENAQRRIVIRVNTLDRDLGSAVAEIRKVIETNVALPDGYFVVMGGQFEAQQTATRRIVLLSAVSLVGVFLVLYSVYPSLSVVLQILFALPAAFVGGVLALVLTDQTLSVAAMVGFISLSCRSRARRTRR